MKLEPIGRRFDDALEGPVWDGSGVLFCLPLRNEIHRWDEATDKTTVVRNATVRIRDLAFAPDGRLYGAQSRARRVVWLSADGGTYYLNAMLDGHRHNDPQHLANDRSGRIWFSDRYTDDSIPGPVGFPPLSHFSVLRLTEESRPADGSVGEWKLERVTVDTTAPAGIALSPDEATLYVVDATVLKAYPIEATGRVGSPQVVREFAGDDQPAGICVDSAGNICVTVSTADGAGRVEVLDPAGSLVDTLDVEGSPTNCCFGGSDQRTLFVTTADGQLYSARGRPSA